MLCLEDADVDLLLMDSPKPATDGSSQPATAVPKKEEGTSGAPASAPNFGERLHEPIVFAAKAEPASGVGGEDVEMADGEATERKKQKQKGKRVKRSKKSKKPPQKMIYTDYDRCHGEIPPEIEIVESPFHLEHRMDTTMDVPRRVDTLHVFGVDIMGTSDVFGYFRGFKPMSVEWLNDSSCNIVLSNEECVVDALNCLGRPIPAADMPDDAIEDKKFCMTYLWYRARPFLKGAARGFRWWEKIDPVHLMLRMATVEDTREPSQPKFTRNLWMQDRQQMKEVLYRDGVLDHELAEHKQAEKAEQAELAVRAGLPSTVVHGQQNHRKRKQWRNNMPAAKRANKKNQNKKKQKQIQDDSAMMLAEEKPAPTHPTAAVNAMPSDLRDFITKLRSDHGVAGSGSAESKPIA